MTEYTPSFLLRNRHIQSIIPSLKVRRPIVKNRAKDLIKNSEEVIIDAGNGVRLQGHFSKNRNRNRNGDLAILIHGWEGSGDSLYLLSAAGRLFREGCDVFRLNMRDHGTSHHLNRELFHSCLLDEVIRAVKQVKETFNGRGRTWLIGFSLGGNFSLRVAAEAPSYGLDLDHVVAVCPVLYPPSTLNAVDTGFIVYQKYFIRKWKKSLKIKMKLFPGEYDFSGEGVCRSLESMTDYFIDRYTEFPDLETYLHGYAITGDRLKQLCIPSHIIISKDDPVIPYHDIHNLNASDSLCIDTVPYGGHCGFLKDFTLKSWVDDRIVEILKTKSSDKER